MRELRLLNAQKPSSGAHSLPEELSKVVTPLKSEVWEYYLRDLPDRDCATYVVKGLSQGFRVGFDYAHHSCTSAKRNMLSASQHPEAINDYLRVEVQKRRVLGPVDLTPERMQISRFGVVPKGHQTGRWRLILDLSYPEGASVNDGIDPALCSLSYTSVDWAARMVLGTGRGALLAKLDLESAYRMIPVHPDDRHLLGMMWNNELFIDSALPFGLRSAPKVFNAVADCLQWIFRQHGVMGIHYLDDFLFIGKGGSQECAHALQSALHLCNELGVGVSMNKLEGPSSSITFLGILLDTEKLELRLPEDKLGRLKIIIHEWRQRKSCTKRELLSLLGHLHHACQVVRPGRSFLRRMITLSKVAKKLHHYIRLNAGFRSDLEWWALFLSDWNGVGMMKDGTFTTPDVVVTSDASGSWGCGAFSSLGWWFQCTWPDCWGSVHITCKELLPIVVACAIWGRGWLGKKIECVTDNAAVVAIVNSGKSEDMLAMHLMRCLFFFTATWQITVHATHIPGKQNVAADALSRNNLPLFFQEVPMASNIAATPIPRELQELLILSRPDWTAPSWRKLFTSILQKV